MVLMILTGILATLWTITLLALVKTRREVKPQKYIRLMGEGRDLADKGR